MPGQNSTITLQTIVDDAATIGELAPSLAVGGFSDTPALSMANDVMTALLLGGPDGQPLNWKWNRTRVTPFLTISLQQDYFIPGLVNLGWLESAYAVNINQNIIDKQKYDLEVVRDLMPAYEQSGYPFKLCWLPNDQLQAGTWGASPLGPSGIAATSYAVNVAQTLSTNTTYTLDLGATVNGSVYGYSVTVTNTANNVISVSVANAITSNQVIVNVGATQTLSGTFVGDGSTHLTIVFASVQSNSPVTFLATKLPYLTVGGVNAITTAQQTFASGWTTNTSATITPATITTPTGTNPSGIQNPGAGVAYTNPLGLTQPPQNATTCIADSNGNLWALTTFGTCGGTEPSWPTTPSYPTYQSPTTAATTVTDGTSVWTAINPKGQGIRLGAVVSSGSQVWQINPIGQMRIPVFTKLAQTLEPLPDDLVSYFKQGFFAECYRRNPDPKVRAKYAQELSLWMKALDKAVRQGQRERDDYGFYPSTSVMDTDMYYSRLSPDRPYGVW